MAHVVVIGAGVIGLQTAGTLLEAGYEVTILAKHWPGDESIDYTSPWAGAIWRTHATPDQVERCQWDIESYKGWMSIAENELEKAEQMGIKRIPIKIYSDDNEIDTNSPYSWYTAHVRDFSILSSLALPQGTRSAHTFTSIAINPVKYLSYLLTSAKSLGAKTIAAELPTSQGLAHALGTVVDKIHSSQDTSIRDLILVVNCTGIGAASLCADSAIYPIRGQTLLVRITPPPAQEILLQDDPGHVTYIVPRPGTDTFILGGTKDADDWRSSPDLEISKGIIERALTLLDKSAQTPKIEVLASQVGLRPGRKGGARVEVEKIEIGEGKVVNVVHQYGHAGAGFQNSIGSAEKVLGLVKEILS